MTLLVQQLVLASGNRGKLREFDELLQPLGWQVQPQSAFGIEPPEETEHSFRGNALLKARHAALHSAHAALADVGAADDGVCVVGQQQFGVDDGVLAAYAQEANQATTRTRRRPPHRELRRASVTGRGAAAMYAG